MNQHNLSSNRQWTLSLLLLWVFTLSSIAPFYPTSNAQASDETTEEDSAPEASNDGGRLTLESTLAAPSSAVAGTEVLAQVKDKTQSLEIGKNGLLPLMAAAKLTTALLLITRRQHVEYGENFFGDKAIAYNQGKTEHLLEAYQRAYPKELFPDFQRFLTIQDDKTTTRDQKNLFHGTSPLGQTALIYSMIDSLMVWEYDRVLAQGKNIPAAVVAEIRSKQQQEFLKDSNRILAAPIPSDILPNKINTRLFAHLTQILGEYRNPVRKELKLPFLYEAYAALAFYQYLQINSRNPEFGKILRWNQGTLPKNLEIVLRNEISEVPLEDLKSSIFHAVEDDDLSSGLRNLLSVADELHYQAWEKRMLHLNTSLLAMTRRQTPKGFFGMTSRVLHMLPENALFDSSLEKQTISDEEIHESGNAEDYLRYFSILIPVFQSSENLQKMLASSFGFKPEQVKASFDNLLPFYNSMMAETERSNRLLHWSLIGSGVGTGLTLLLFPSEWLAMAMLVTDLALTTGASSQLYFNAIGELPHLFEALQYTIDRNGEPLAHVDPATVDQNLLMSQEALNNWYLSLGLISVQAASLFYLRVAAGKSAVPVVGTIKENIPFNHLLKNMDKRLAVREVQDNRLRLALDPASHNRQLRYLKEYGMYEEGIDDLAKLRRVGSPAFRPEIAQKNFDQLQQLIEDHVVSIRGAKARIGGKQIIPAQELAGYRSKLVTDLKKYFPKTYRELWRRYRADTSWFWRDGFIQNRLGFRGGIGNWIQTDGWLQRLIPFRNSLRNGIQAMAPKPSFSDYVVFEVTGSKYFKGLEPGNLVAEIMPIETPAGLPGDPNAPVSSVKITTTPTTVEPRFTLNDFYGTDGFNVTETVKRKRYALQFPLRWDRPLWPFRWPVRTVNVETAVSYSTLQLSQSRVQQIRAAVQAHPEFEDFLHFMRQNGVEEMLDVAETTRATGNTWKGMTTKDFEEFMELFSKSGNASGQTLADLDLSGSLDPGLITALKKYRVDLASARSLEKLFARNPGVEAQLQKRYQALTDLNQGYLKQVAPRTTSLAAKKEAEYQFLNRLRHEHPYLHQELTRRYEQSLGRTQADTYASYVSRSIDEGARKLATPNAINQRAFNHIETSRLGHTAFLENAELARFSIPGATQSEVDYWLEVGNRFRIFFQYAADIKLTQNPFRQFFQAFSVRGRALIRLIRNYRNLRDASYMDLLKIGRSRKLAEGVIRSLHSETQLLQLARQNAVLGRHPEVMRMASIHADGNRLELLRSIQRENNGPASMTLIKAGRNAAEKIPTFNQGESLAQWLVRYQLRSGMDPLRGLRTVKVLRMPIATVKTFVKGASKLVNGVGSATYRAALGSRGPQYWQYARWGLLAEWTAGMAGDLLTRDGKVDFNLDNKDFNEILLHRMSNSGMLVFLMPFALQSRSMKGAMATQSAFTLLWSGSLATAHQIMVSGQRDFSVNGAMSASNYAKTSILYGNVFELPFAMATAPLQLSLGKLGGIPGAAGQLLVAGVDRFTSAALFNELTEKDGLINKGVQDAAAGFPRAQFIGQPQVDKIMEQLAIAEKNGVREITMMASGFPDEARYAGDFLDGLKFDEIQLVDPENKMTLEDLVEALGMSQEELTQGEGKIFDQQYKNLRLETDDIRRGLVRLAQQKGASQPEDKTWTHWIKSWFVSDTQPSLAPHEASHRAFESKIMRSDDPRAYLKPMLEESLTPLEKKLVALSKERDREKGILDRGVNLGGETIPSGIVFTQRTETADLPPEDQEDDHDPFNLEPLWQKVLGEMTESGWGFDWLLENTGWVYKQYLRNPMNPNEPLLKSVVVIGRHQNVLFILGPDGFQQIEPKIFAIRLPAKKKDGTDLVIEDGFVMTPTVESDLPDPLKAIPSLWLDPKKVEAEKRKKEGKPLSEDELLHNLAEERNALDGTWTALAKKAGSYFGLWTPPLPQPSEPTALDFDPHTSLGAFLHSVIVGIQEDPGNPIYQDVAKIKVVRRILPIESPANGTKNLDFSYILTRRWFLDHFELLDKDGKVLESVDWKIDRGTRINPTRWLEEQREKRK